MQIERGLLASFNRLSLGQFFQITISRRFASIDVFDEGDDQSTVGAQCQFLFHLCLVLMLRNREPASAEVSMEARMDSNRKWSKINRDRRCQNYLSIFHNLDASRVSGLLQSCRALV